MRRFLLVGFFCALFLTLVRTGWSAEAGPPKSESATYAGTETCKACHAPSFEKFSHTTMGKIFLFNPRNETEKLACENCHGPGSAHVAAGGGKGVGGLITYRKDSGETAEMQNQPCLACHERGIQTYWNASPHAGRGLSCVTCHTLMERTSGRQLTKLNDVTPFFVKRAEIEICGECHMQRRAQNMRSSHMPLREGKMVCSSCHNPHGSPNPAMLKQNSINENCYSCHTERRGPFLWEHPPVFENCALCHDPHGSVNDRLLKVSDPRVCNSCHMVGSHPVTPRPGKVTPIPGNRTRNFEPSVFFFNRSCTNCHSQVHGSNHPGGVFFTR